MRRIRLIEVRTGEESRRASGGIEDVEGELDVVASPGQSLALSIR